MKNFYTSLEEYAPPKERKSDLLKNTHSSEKYNK